MLSSRLAPWQLYEALMAPNVAKPPWLAAWDRMVRFIMRFDQRDHQMGGESPLHGLFVKHATASTGRIGADGFRRAMRSCGLNRAAVEAYCKEFKASVKDQLEAFTSNDRSRRKQIEVIFLSEANERRKRALGPGFGGGGGRNARGGGGEDKVSKKRVEQKLLEEALISRSADDPLTDRELQLLQELGYSQFAPLFMQDRMPPSGEYVFAMVSDEGGMTPPDEQVAAEESGAAVGEASAGGTA